MTASGRTQWLYVLCAITSACTCRVGDGSRMNERGAATWQIDGVNVPIERTYFEPRGSDLSFAVEWTCSDCVRDSPLSQEEALRIARPVLWHAIESGETGRISITKAGEGPVQANRLVGVIAYSVHGKPERVRVTVDNLDLLTDWTWVIGPRTYRVVRPGYYFDLDSHRLFFTVQWLETELCNELVGIDDNRAAALAMPIMKRIVARQLYRIVPRHGDPSAPPEMMTRDVDRVGVELGCPAAACAGSVDCPANGYRVARSIAEITAAP